MVSLFQFQTYRGLQALMRDAGVCMYSEYDLSSPPNLLPSSMMMMQGMILDRPTGNLRRASNLRQAISIGQLSDHLRRRRVFFLSSALSVAFVRRDPMILLIQLAYARAPYHSLIGLSLVAYDRDGRIPSRPTSSCALWIL